MEEFARPPEGHCAFYLPRKNRFCRFRPNQGQKYCAEHACKLGVELERKRIMCPLNPKHTCYEDSLHKHLKKCNSRKRTQTEDYYEEGINTGIEDGYLVRESQTAVKATDPEILQRIIDKVNKLYQEHVGQLERDVRSHECLQEELNNPTYGLPALRHRRQQASLIGQLESFGLLEPGHCYVEMGAGKGQLSHWVRKAVSSHDDAAFLLVDRSSIRYKVDGYHKEEKKIQFERIKMDIEHLKLGKVPMISQSHRPIVAIGKHLCGAATDLTLRCLVNTLRRGDRGSDVPNGPKRPRRDSGTDGQQSGDPEQGQDFKPVSRSEETVISGGGLDESSAWKLENESFHKDGNESVSACDLRTASIKDDSDAGMVEDCVRPAGILIALCCHHQCSWRAYVGKHFMRQCGFSVSDFNLLTRLSSWAVCGWQGQDGSSDTAETAVKQSQDGSEAIAHQNTGSESTISQHRESENMTPQHPGSDTTTSQRTETESSKSQHSGTEKTVLQHAVVEMSETDEADHLVQDLFTETDKKCGLQMSEREKEAVGLRCKRLLDYGRVCYLRDYGMKTSLKEYIDPSQTPENVVLVAVPSAVPNMNLCGK